MMVMLLELAEVKNYLRVDTNEEDGLVTRLSQSAEKLCMDVARIADAEEFAALGDTAKTAVLYATAYLYEHREEADHHALTLTLRSLLFGVRKEGF
ncbi:MAG: phage gp6-like head-tail connector protein [Bacteroidales bacterium]|nr:phage gp6-like head-tail connector protein [Bacteroidales bacterium]